MLNANDLNTLERFSNKNILKKTKITIEQEEISNTSENTNQPQILAYSPSVSDTLEVEEMPIEDFYYYSKEHFYASCKRLMLNKKLHCLLQDITTILPVLCNHIYDFSLNNVQLFNELCLQYPTSYFFFNMKEIDDEKEMYLFIRNALDILHDYKKLKSMDINDILSDKFYRKYLHSKKVYKYFSQLEQNLEKQYDKYFKNLDKKFKISNNKDKKKKSVNNVKPTHTETPYLTENVDLIKKIRPNLFKIFTLLEDTPLVFFLLDEAENIVYVNTTSNLKEDLISTLYKLDKYWNKIMYFQICLCDNITNGEIYTLYYIYSLQPIYNIELNPTYANKPIPTIEVQPLLDIKGQTKIKIFK